MKNSILSSTAFAALLVCTLLLSAPLYSMQLNTVDDDYSDETETASSEEAGCEQIGWGVRPFFASQIAGARELLTYGRHAAEDLVALMTQSNSLDTQKTENDVETRSVMDTLVKCFLNDEKKYQEHIKSWPKDIRALFARYILLNHPLIKIIRDRMGKHLCKQTLQSSVDAVHTAAFNAVGDKIVLGCKRGTVAIWDLAKNERLHEFQGHATHVTTVQFNAKGDRIITASDRDTKIWDVDTGECLQEIQGGSARFNREGDKIVTASYERTVKVWDVESGTCLHKFEGHVDSVVSAEFNRSGDKIVSISRDHTAKIWDLDTRTCLHTLAGHTSDLCSARFNRLGDKIVTASFDGTAKIWDTLSGKCLHILSGHQRYVYSAEFSRSGDTIVTASHDGTIKIWDVDTGECTLTLRTRNHVMFAAFNRNGDRIIAKDGLRRAQIWNVKTGKPLCSLIGHTGSVMRAQFNKSGDTIVTTSYDGLAKLWDSARLEAITQWLENECTLEQALLLHCIYETRIVHALIKKRERFGLLRFDFKACPHLEQHFDMMPPEVQACLEPFIKRCSALRSRGRLPS